MCHYVDWFASLHMALCLLQASSPTMSCICLAGTYADFPVMGYGMFAGPHT